MDTSHNGLMKDQNEHFWALLGALEGALLGRRGGVTVALSWFYVKAGRKAKTAVLECIECVLYYLSRMPTLV